MKTTAITVRERFKSLEQTRSLDTKNRLTLSNKVATIFHKKRVNAFSLYLGQDGDILLRPISYVPSKTLWSKKVAVAVKNGSAAINAGRARKVNNLDNFFEQL